MVTDDTKIAYAGEDHEQVLIRTFLALSNLMADGGDAHAYALQIGTKQQELAKEIEKKRKETRRRRRSHRSRRVAAGRPRPVHPGDAQ